MEKKNFFIELTERFMAPSPEFHAKIRNFAATMVAIGSTALAVHPSFIPDNYYEYITFAIAVAAGMGISAQATSKNH